MPAELARTVRRAAVAMGLCGIALVAGLLSGCAHRGLEVVPEAGPGIDGAPSGGRQALLRLRYRGIDGRGRLRLTVRRASATRFQLTAADVMGRPLWSFDSNAEASLLLDHRRSEYCRIGGDVVLRAVALSELPLSLLPRVLFGELPFEAPEAAGGDVEILDGDGRRWTGKRGSDGRATNWTLWHDGRAVLWWSGSPGGGVLSHRDGAQVTWSVVADEPLSQALEPLVLPEGYDLGQCDGNDVS